MSDQPEDDGKEAPPVEGDGEVVTDSPPAEIEIVDEVPPPEETMEIPEVPPPADTEIVDEVPPPEETVEIQEVPPPAESEIVDEVPPLESKPVEEQKTLPDEGMTVETREGAPPEGEISLEEEAKTGQGSHERELQVTDLMEEVATDGGGETKVRSRLESTISEIQALTTAQILDRLKKSYAQACKTLAVIGNIQRRESVLQLEEHQIELIKKFSKFEGHLEQLGFITEHETQTSKQALERKVCPKSCEDKPLTPQDNLPQVIICGPDGQVPKIVVCEAPKRNQKRTQAQFERELLLKVQKELLNKCEFMKEKLMFKETIIGNLHRQMCSLQKDNCMLRMQLARANPSPMQQHCQCPGTTQNECLGSCPVHCRRGDSLDPAKETSKISQKEDTQLVAGSICSPTCPNFKASLAVVNEELKSNAKGSGTKLERTAQHPCPSKCPFFKANSPSVQEESKSSAQAKGTVQNPCLPRCPYFKANVPEMKEEHVCSNTCPYFNTNMPKADECMQPDAGDKNIENIEVELQEHNLDSHKDDATCAAGEVSKDCEVCVPSTDPENIHIMRLCRPTTKKPTYCELKNEHDNLKMDFNIRMAELSTLRTDIVKHKEMAEQACVAQQRAEIETKNMSEILKTIENKRLMLLVPKEKMVEMEQQIVVAQERFYESQDELEELRERTEYQSNTLDEYKRKYLQSHEHVEDQKGQIDMLEMENSRISENVALEIQQVKNQFEVRLQALAPLPDLLKATQEKLQELQQQLEEKEVRYTEMDAELQEAKEKILDYIRQLDDSMTSSNMELQGKGSMRKKLAEWEKKYNALKDENTEMAGQIAVMEETATTAEIRLTEKLHEVAQLVATLEMLRAESARQVSRAKERLDTLRVTLQTQIMELEEQVAQSRAIARTARKDRDNIRQRMQSQINSLCESFEQAQVTIRSLQEQVGFFNDKT